MSACETVRKKSVREKAREILILSLQKLFPARNLRRIKSGKTWQQLTSKVSYLCLACATDEKTAAEKTAAEKKMAAVSDRSKDEKTAAEKEIAAVSDRSKIATCYAVACYAVACYAVASTPVATEHSLFVSAVKVQVLPNS
jgi:hypothetical protein